MKKPKERLVLIPESKEGKIWILRVSLEVYIKELANAEKQLQFYEERIEEMESKLKS